MNLPVLKNVVVASSADMRTLARQIMQLLASVRESLSRLLANEDALSTYQDVELVAATPNAVSHKLDLKEGQTPSGWLVVDIDANTTVRRNSWDHRFITLQAANDCTARIKVW